MKDIVKAWKENISFTDLIVAFGLFILLDKMSIIEFNSENSYAIILGLLTAKYLKIKFTKDGE